MVVTKVATSCEGAGIQWTTIELRRRHVVRAAEVVWDSPSVVGSGQGQDVFALAPRLGTDVKARWRFHVVTAERRNDSRRFNSSRKGHHRGVKVVSVEQPRPDIDTTAGSEDWRHVAVFGEHRRDGTLFSNRSLLLARKLGEKIRPPATRDHQSRGPLPVRILAKDGPRKRIGRRAKNDNHSNTPFTCEVGRLEKREPFEDRRRRRCGTRGCGRICHRDRDGRERGCTEQHHRDNQRSLGAHAPF